MKRESTRDAEGWLTAYAGRKVERVSTLSDPPAPAVTLPFSTIALKGTFGSGKSTIPIELINSHPDHYYLTVGVEDKKPAATYLPSIQTVIFGTYLTNCGGCDGFAPFKTREYLVQFWKKQVHILYEGAIVGGIISTFYEDTQRLRGELHRDCSFCFLDTPVDECIRRIYIRNGGKKFNESNIGAKHKSVAKAWELYEKESKVHICKLSTLGTKPEVLARFIAQYPQFSSK